MSPEVVSGWVRVGLLLGVLWDMCTQLLFHPKEHH